MTVGASALGLSYGPGESRQMAAAETRSPRQLSLLGRQLPRHHRRRSHPHVIRAQLYPVALFDRRMAYRPPLPEMP